MQAQLRSSELSPVRVGYHLSSYLEVQLLEFIFLLHSVWMVYYAAMEIIFWNKKVDGFINSLDDL
ncbi:MAG: hypothetical protein WCT02_04130, partial [Candidatus Paceibacterota bacterium]